MNAMLLPVLIASLAVLTALPARAAAAAREFGVGVVIGEPIGGTAKLWLDRERAVDVGAGFSDGNGVFWADALWHFRDLVPQVPEGFLAPYLGAGPRLRTGGDAQFGIRTLVGLAYRTARHPLELFAEAGPMFRLTQGGSVDADGGVGVRVYFGPGADGARR